ncbi:hypothetical protein Y032_0222g2647 [Ancylostoma ceylanicum]|uniref:Uncharacterized protein n=1 Tax=Ancylostoma ceylanicum TaxID=53326 RepID=A0A016SHV7_9BILA|nr:hypothetical protein Y032_0222g2647 [Ancylostoma ceylanicum]
MPRFKDERTWKLLQDVPPNLFALTREALSLRQQVVAVRQSLIFLQRCKRTNIMPSFIKNKKIETICNLPDNDPRITSVYQSILNIVIKEKQCKLYSSLLKCNAKELACKRLLPSHLWRRIEGGSRLICDSVRSKVKSSLSAKYDRLSGMVCENHLDRGKDLPNTHRTHDARSENDVETARVTVIGDIHLSTNALAFLNLGPSFSPSQSINALTCRRIVGGLQKLRDMLRNRARRENAPQSSAPEHKRLLPTVPFPRSFYKEAQPFPAADIKFRVLSSGILEVLNKFKRVHQSNLSQEHWQGFKEVRNLIANNSIRLSVSDKGGEFVVLPQTLDREITELHLSDTTIYQRATEKDFLTQCKRLNDTWISVGKSAGLDERPTKSLRKICIPCQQRCTKYGL